MSPEVTNTPEQSHVQRGMLAAGGALLVASGLALVACGDKSSDQQVFATDSATTTTIESATSTTMLPATTIEVSGTLESSTTSTTKPNNTTTTVTIALPGNIEDVAIGNDQTIRAENEADLYQCGGVKGETWVINNLDGTTSTEPFSPDKGLIPRMNESPELAQHDEAFWRGIMGNEAFEALAQMGFENANHDPKNEVTADGVSESYKKILTKQVAATLDHNVISANFSCAHDKVSFYDYRNLIAGETTLTGVVILATEMPEFVKLMQKEGKDVSALITQTMTVKNKDGSEEVVTIIYLKHRECGNNEIVPPNVVPSETTVPETTTTSHTDTTFGPKIPSKPNDGPNSGPGAGGEPGGTGTTSTTRAGQTPPTTFRVPVGTTAQTPPSTAAPKPAPTAVSTTAPDGTAPDPTNIP